MLQSLLSTKAGHGMPPNCGAVLIVLLRVCRPPPQGLSHFLNGPHAVTTQLTGLQGRFAKHLTTSSALPQLALRSVGFATSLVRFLVPQPHVTVHRLHDVHALAFPHRGDGHGCVLHFFDACLAGQSSVPYCFTSRFLYLSPPPHGWVQLPHALHAFMWQRSLHGFASHLITSMAEPHFAPFFGSW